MWVKMELSADKKGWHVNQYKYYLFFNEKDSIKDLLYSLNSIDTVIENIKEDIKTLKKNIKKNT